MSRNPDRQIFVWTERFETGLDEVDHQHRHLVGLLNSLARAHAAGEEGAALLQIFDQLADYTVYHFNSEEALMGEAAVQGAHIEAHRRAHADFVHQVAAARAAVASKPAEPVSKLLTFLSKWLIFHILGVDRRMAVEVLALREGCTPEQAREHAEHAMADVSGVLLQAMNGLYEDLAASTHDAWEANRQLQSEVAERRHTEAALQARLREQDCLYLCSDALRNPGNSIVATLGRVLACLAETWPWGRAVVAAAELPEGSFTSGEQPRSKPRLGVELRVEGMSHGKLLLYWEEDGAAPDPEPVQGEERTRLLEQIGVRISGYLERAQAQEVRRKLWQAVQQSPVSILITDREGKIEYANPCLCAVSGYDIDELIGKTPAVFKSGDTAPAVYRELWDTISGGATWRGELRNRRKNGELFWEEITITPVFDSAGTLTNYVAAKEDVTEHRAAEAALRRSKDELEHALADLKASNAELARLAQMSDMIQSCAEESEVLQVIRHTCSALFPGGSGALALRTEIGGPFRTCATWGEGLESAPTYLVDDCWALRRGQPHDSTGDGEGPSCEHLTGFPPGGVRCLPLSVAGETLGSLMLSLPWSADKQLFPAWERRVGMAADAIKMALSNFRLREALRAQALHDPLTGLYNRRFFDDALRRALLRSSRNGEPCALVMLDIDRFKQYNDKFGHDAGDAVLQYVAGGLQRAVREADLVCRVGGEELAVLMPGAGIDQACARAGDLIATVRSLEVPFSGAHLPHVTCSAGVSAGAGRSVGALQLVKQADEALYMAKNSGRDRVCCHREPENGPGVSECPGREA